MTIVNIGFVDVKMYEKYICKYIWAILLYSIFGGVTDYFRFGDLNCADALKNVNTLVNVVTRNSSSKASRRQQSPSKVFTVRAVATDCIDFDRVFPC